MRKLAAVTLLGTLSACSGGENKIEIEQPHSVATVDEPSYLLNEAGSVESSANVNGRRFNMTLYEFTDLVASLGVQTAYNLDGGDSAIMVLGGKKVNEPELDNIRNLYDIIYFASAWDGES